ncbi:hypothetical protein PAXINDRAFT_20901 [Paxillus involutus ATCC 200175]|uniref:Uncharacterized protein n=1 Tax=Paxillus involutus ATCC 200175 TaxID=664439 RepID=A0A0C9SMB2_PAXIN|nr:hypothetical protein PAXINDRAFT_20901 [Paxillus involutus ATCC 200175]
MSDDVAVPLFRSSHKAGPTNKFPGRDYVHAQDKSLRKYAKAYADDTSCSPRIHNSHLDFTASFAKLLELSVPIQQLVASEH